MRSLVLVACVVCPLAAEGPEPTQLFVTPSQVLLGRLERASLEAVGAFPDGTTGPVTCTWRLAARRGEARLAVGQGPTTAAIVEAGVAPALVTVTATFEGKDRRLVATATVLCTTPHLSAPARCAVGEPAAVDLTVPLVLDALAGEVTVAVIESPEGSNPTLVRMDEGPLGPVGGSYVVKMPVRAGALQVGCKATAAGRHVLQGSFTLAGKTLTSDVAVVEALPVARLEACRYEAGPPPNADARRAPPGGHAWPGPVVVVPPRAVTPVVLGYGPGDEALGRLAAVAQVGRMVRRGKGEVFEPRRERDGLWYFDDRPVARPAPGPAVPREIRIHACTARGTVDKNLTAELVVAEVRPAAAIPLPVGATVELRVVLGGHATAARLVADAEGRPTRPAPEPGTGAVEVVAETIDRVTLVGRRPGLARVRTRRRVADRSGGEEALRLDTEVLVLGPDDLHACDADGRPVASAARAVYAVAGSARVRLGADGSASVVGWPEGLGAAGAPLALMRRDGTAWLIPVGPVPGAR